jgi:sialidase-1
VRKLLMSLCVFMALATTLRGQTPIDLDNEVRRKCVAILRGGLLSDEFWPSMHAAEGLSVNGMGAEVVKVLEPKLPQESDDQRRCGLARELVRAGDLSKTKVLVEVLASKDPYGHVHACESLYKVFQVGDADALRRAMTQKEQPLLAIMAAAALARADEKPPLGVLRDYVRHEDAMIARTAAWVLARVGSAQDIPELRLSRQRFSDPLTLAYFEHAMAALGDSNAVVALVANLSHADPAVRTYACEFAPDAQAALGRDRLIELLNDSNLDIRIRAADALLRLSRPMDKQQSSVKE